MPVTIIRLKCAESACPKVQDFFHEHHIKLLRHTSNPSRYAAKSKNLEISEIKHIEKKLSKIEGVSGVLIRPIIIPES